MKTEAQKRAQKKWRYKNKSYIRQKAKNWKLNNPEKMFAIEIKRTYGISLDFYKNLLEKQNHCCAICFQKETSKNGRLFIDHDHSTGQVRGLLCLKCNTILGMARDNPQVLISCIKYLSENVSPKSL